MDLDDLLTESTNPDGSLNHSLVKERLSVINESLSKKETNLESFILGLGTALTSTQLEERTRGIEILADFIELLSPENSQPTEVEFLLEYLVSRLSDHHSFLPIIVRAILHLARSSAVSEKQAINVFIAIQKEVADQQLPIQERFLVYQLIGVLFSSHLETYKSISHDFLCGFIQIMEGERDPRCLLLCFDLFSRVATNLPLGNLEEELFDTISCYFPIVYHPTKEKGIQITRDDLHVALKKCFLASPAFAPFSYLLLTEKLESDIESAKIDAYDMIKSCAPVYGGKAISSFLPPIWETIRLDVLRMGIGRVAEKATETMAAVLLTLQSSPEMMDKFLKDIFDGMEGTLTKLSLGLFKPSIQFMATISSCSDLYVKRFAEFVFPILMKKLIFDQSSEVREHLEAFTIFFRAWKTLEQNTLLPRIPDQEILITNLLSLFDADETHIKIAAIECLINLVQCSFKWELREEQALSRGLLYLVLSTSFSTEDRIRNKTKDLLTEFSIRHRETCKSEITQNLLNKLPDSCDLSADQWERLDKTLEAFKCCLVGQKTSTETIDIKLSNLACNLFQQSHVHSELLSSVRSSLSDCICSIIDSTNVEVYHLRILSSVLKQGDKRSSIEIDENINKIVNRILAFTSSSRKLCILENFLNSLRTLQPDASPSCDEPSITPSMPLLKAIECILLGLSIDFQFSWTDLIQSILMHIHSDNFDQLINPTARIVEIILNKSPEPCLSNLTNFLTNFFNSKLSSLVSDGSTQSPTIQIMLSSNRGLVIRGGPYFNCFSAQLLHLMLNFEDETTVSLIAKNFVPSHGADDNMYSPSTGFNVSPFYAQKYFGETNQSLLMGYNSHEGWRKQCFALCILNHLKNLPKTVIRDEISRFHSLTLFNLEESSAPENQMTALDCLIHLIEAHPVILARHLSGTINRLLGLTKSSPYLEIRRKSLECLTTIAKTSNEITLLPYRLSVLQSLKESLDDRKRIVRYACTVAKHHWTLIGQPV